MDLGALVCTPRSPSCNDCPLATGCAAFKAGRQAELPVVRSRRKLQVRRIFALLLQHDQSVLLERRPERGIWGGLWSLPRDGKLQKIIPTGLSLRVTNLSL